MSNANKSLVSRFSEELFERRNLAVVDELIAEDFVYHNTALPNANIRGRNAFRAIVTSLFTAFPDLRFAEDDLLAEGDKVVSRGTFVGTHGGEFMGIPATNKPVAWSAMIIARIAGGRLAEEWINADLLSLMRQLESAPART